MKLRRSFSFELIGEFQQKTCLAVELGDKAMDALRNVTKRIALARKTSHPSGI
jgi:hypothetical protein